jgi:hypothetical protein
LGSCYAGVAATRERASILGVPLHNHVAVQLIKRCPVSGAELTPGDDWGNLIYMSLCMDQGSGHTLQARRGCAFQSTDVDSGTCAALAGLHSSEKPADRCFRKWCSVQHLSLLAPQDSDDPTKSGEAWMLKMSEWAPQSLGGSMSAGEALDPKGDEGKSPTPAEQARIADTMACNSLAGAMLSLTLPGS